MKKIAFSCAITVAIITVSISSNYQSKSEQVNILLLENIECLSYPETDILFECVGYGSLDCPNRNQKVILYY